MLRSAMSKLMRPVLARSASMLAAPRLIAPKVPAFRAASQIRMHSNEQFDEVEQFVSLVRVGKPAPKFSATALVDGQFKTVSLDDYKGKYVVLFFYPLDFTFVCPTEIIEFSDRAEEFRKMGCEVVACSIDSHFSHSAWVQTPRNKGGLGKMNIPIIADLTKDISRNYGVLMEEKGFSARGTFIIDGKGTLRQYSVNDPPVGRNVDEVLRLVSAFQYTDKNGEVCPAKWTKAGDATINPAKKLDYFEKANK